MPATQKDFSAFKPRDYLNEYYSKIDQENHSLLEFFIDAYGNVKNNALMLEFGGGPTIYQLISAAEKVQEIHFADYLDDNLAEIRKWHQQHPEAFDWSDFFHRALKLEGNQQPDKAIAAREAILRERMTKILQADAHQKYPLGLDMHEHYDVLGVHFVPESITDSRANWERVLKNICSLLKPGGLLITSALLGASHWRAGDHIFPATNISADDLVQALERQGFTDISHRIIAAEVTDENSEEFAGYHGMVFLTARKELKKA